MKKRTQITNTKKQAEQHPMLTMMGLAAMGTSAFIQDQEKTGQRQVIDSSQLPIKGMDIVMRAVIEANGGKILDQSDELFYNVRLPKGWTIKATDHSMWNDVLDEKKRVRASFFYKAAFYDRDAFINLVPRFSCDTRGEGNKRFVVIKDADNTILWTSKTVGSYQETYEFQDAAQKMLVERYPDYKNPNAYWDISPSKFA